MLSAWISVARWGKVPGLFIEEKILIVVVVFF